MNYLHKKWLIIKEQLDVTTAKIFVNEREICYISIGQNIGFEQNGKHNNFERPVLVLRKFSDNLFIGIPLSKQLKNSQYYFIFKFNSTPSAALLSQIRLFDNKRVVRKIGYISPSDFLLLKEKLKNLLKL